MATAFGLDFGTSNSSLSVNRDGAVELLDIDRNSPIPLALKSVLYFLEGPQGLKTYIGYEAVNQYIATEAAGRYMQSIKTFLPDPLFSKTLIFNRFYPLEELISFFLKTIKKRGEALVGGAVDRVVLGRPVVFSEESANDRLAEKRLARAAELAGFKEVLFQAEPVAAALSFENSLSAGEEKLVLVGDFGAGTSDFTILKARKDERRRLDRSADILAAGGVYIGGDVFDAALMWEKVCKYYGRDVQTRSLMNDSRLPMPSDIMNKLKQWNLIPLLRTKETLHSISNYKYLTDPEERHLIENLENLIKDNYGYTLFQSVERAKCGLSDADAARIRLDNYAIAIDEPVTRAEFEAYIAREVAKIDGCVASVIAKAGLLTGAIDAVFLTGGSSYIPMIQKVFADRFDRAIIRQSDAFTSVAYGLGLYADILTR
ncbi:MAG: Hsp70 family protein [Deltaproteobacteria bacterium]|nr:Hsp70 family protein [Deltaproteobacteria bacterium]